jgi:hypothetical protein
MGCPFPEQGREPGVRGPCRPRCLDCAAIDCTVLDRSVLDRTLSDSVRIAGREQSHIRKGDELFPDMRKCL